MRLGRGLAVLTLAALLSACAQQPSTPVEWRQQAEAIGRQQQWELEGKIGLRAPDKAGSAFLGWKQDGGHYRLLLSGALGLGRLALDGDAKGVSWVRDGRRGRHEDPEALVGEVWGWRVPIAALQFWVRGIPDPALPVESQGFEQGVLTRFRQSGWTIEPSAHRSVGDLLLPHRVRLEGGAGASLTIAVSRWTLPPP